MGYVNHDHFGIHLERQAYSPPPRRVRFASPPRTPTRVSFEADPFQEHRPLVPEPNVIINNYERGSSPSSTSSSERDRPYCHRRRSPSLAYSPTRYENDKVVHGTARETVEMRRQLLALQATNRRDEGRHRLMNDTREDVEMRRVKHELSLRQESRSRADLKLKLKEEFEKERLEKEIKEKKETQRREKEAKEAVEQYKLQEADKALKDKNANEEFEKQYKVWLEQRLTLSGLDEKHIKAIMNKEKIPGDSPSRGPERYTRMLRKRVSLETLRAFAINFEYDSSEDETIIVKRHVPEWEIKELDAHTRFVRERRERVPSKGKGHHKGGREIMTGKRKHGKNNLPLLMYLAGYRP